jgi:hypothetical protein
MAGKAKLIQSRLSQPRPSQVKETLESHYHVQGKSWRRKGFQEIEAQKSCFFRASINQAKSSLSFKGALINRHLVAPAS